MDQRSGAAGVGFFASAALLRERGGRERDLI